LDWAERILRLSGTADAVRRAGPSQAQGAATNASIKGFPRSTAPLLSRDDGVDPLHAFSLQHF